MLAITAAWDWACSGGTAEACSRLVLDALEDGAIVAHDPGFLAVLAAATLLYTDRPEVIGVLDAAQAEAHRSGSLFVALGVDMWRGHALLLRGELEDAQATLNRAQEGFDAFGIAQTNAGAYTKSNIVRVLVEQGRLEEARRVQDRPIAIIPGSDGDAIARRAEIELLLAEDRPQDALAAADALHAGLRRISNPAVAPWRTLRALALDRLGRSEEALDAALEELAAARAFGAPGTVGRALRIAGTVEREAGIARLEEAVAVLEGSTARLELARALLAHGGALRRARQPTAAREPLRRALELAESCSAPPLAEQARAELHATGARPRRTALGGVASLTPSERRVADMAAAGQSNRDIAQTLYVTLKTVEVHLSNAYRKLDIRSRHELAGALAA
jgi:DNA-binding NarL/FixJ family response regulator